jgi:hypothetical protein
VQQRVAAHRHGPQPPQAAPEPTQPLTAERHPNSITMLRRADSSTATHPARRGVFVRQAQLCGPCRVAA